MVTHQPVLQRLIRHHTEYGQSGQRVQMKRLLAGGQPPPGRSRALVLSASLIAAISHGFRPPYRLIDSIAASRGAWSADLYFGYLGYRPACSYACMQLFAAPAQANLGASRAGPAIPKTRDFRTPGNEGRYQAPQCRLPGPERTLHGYAAYYRL